MYPLIFFILALLGAGVHLKCSKESITFSKTVEILLAYLIPCFIGGTSIFAFIAHVFFGPEVARMIGWAPHSPFQFEVGIASLALALTALAGIWFRRGFWLAITFCHTCFLWGAAYGHFVQMGKGDHAAYNSGMFLYIGDIFIPLICFLLVLIYTYQKRIFTHCENR